MNGDVDSFCNCFTNVLFSISCPANATTRVTNCHVHVIIHARDPLLYFVIIGYNVPVASFSLSLYFLHVLRGSLFRVTPSSSYLITNVKQY